MWTFGRKIAMGFAVSFVLLLGIGTISYRVIDSLTGTSYLVTHTHRVLEHVAALLSLLKDAETGQRGFIITGQETYLEPYEAAVRNIPAVVKELQDLIADNPAQQKRMGALVPLAMAKLDELKNTIEMRRKDGRDAVTARVQTGIGKKYMDDMRVIAAQMEQEERGLLKERAEECREGCQWRAHDHCLRHLVLRGVRLRGGLHHHAILDARNRFGRAACAAVVGRVAIGVHAAGCGGAGVRHGHDRDHDDHQRVAGHLAADRRERAARGHGRRADAGRRAQARWPSRAATSRSPAYASRST
ncbi:MAG: CHASE3 domain-containing protein [Aquabacterium sp.]